MLNTTLCYVLRGDEVLMLHRTKKKNDINQDKWIGIGGKFEGMESPDECLLREAKEETGLTVLPETIKEFGLVLRLQKSDYLPNTVFEQENYYYTCEVSEEAGEQKLDDYEAEEGFTLEFVTPEEAIRTNQNCHCTEWDKAMVERETKVLEILKQMAKSQG